MKFYILLFIFFIFKGVSFAQNAKKSLIIYNSEFEKNVFSNLENATNLELLIAIGDHVTENHLVEAKAEIQLLKQALKKKGFESSDPKKQAKLLESVFQGKVLKKYKSISPFYHIFFDGEFNCVSSSALYATLLDEFNIPYTIKELPTHVYVIMYPEGVRVKVETTVPKKGYETRSDGEVEKTMKMLIKLNVVTEEWVEKRGMRVAYNEYFYSDNGITLRQLTGLQYQNECVNDFNFGNSNEALSEIMKSQKIYPTEQGRLFMLELLEMKLRNGKLETVDDFDVFIAYSNTKNAELEKIEYNFAVFLREKLLLKGQKSLVDSVQIQLNAAIHATPVLNKINEIYYIGLTEYYATARNDNKAIECAAKCLEYNKDNKYAMMAITHSVMDEISRFDSDDYLDNYFDEMTDEEFDAFFEDENAESDGEIIEAMLSVYVDRYPFLADNPLFQAMYFYVFAEISESAFSGDDEEEGEKYFKKALEVMDTIEDKDIIDKQMYGWMFSSAAAYYYREDEFKKALEIVNQGLKFAPEHARLLAKLKIIESRLNK